MFGRTAFFTDAYELPTTVEQSLRAAYNRGGPKRRERKEGTMGILAAYAVPHPPLIIPSVGRGEERGIHDTVRAYREVARRIVKANPETIVVTSPHAPMYRDAFHVTTGAELSGSMARFGAPQTRVDARIDQELVQAICDQVGEMADGDEAQAGVLPAGEPIPLAGSTWRDREMDHATFIPLWFANEAFREVGQTPDYRIVRIGLSGFSFEAHRALGHAVARAVEALGRHVVFVASGDLSHKLKADGPYGFAPEGPQFDAQIAEIFSTGILEGLFAFDEDFCDAAAECGLRSFQIMAGALEEDAALLGSSFGHELLSCEGPFGVGYAVAAFERESADDAESAASGVEGQDAGVNDDAGAEGAGAGADGEAERAASDVRGDALMGSGDGASARTDAKRVGEAPTASAASSESETRHAQGAAGFETGCPPDPYVALARASVEGFVRTGRPIARPKGLPQELLDERAGVFVSLHEDGELRGCIGTIGPTEPCVADEIIQNGVSACSRDPRFPPVRADELDYLEISVDVLFPAEPVESEAELDPVRYGVIVTKGWRRGLLLPNLESVDTVRQQVDIAKRKAGIGLDERGVRLERFEVVRHERGGEPRRER